MTREAFAGEFPIFQGSDVLRLAVAAANSRGALLEIAEGARGDSGAPR